MFNFHQFTLHLVSHPLRHSCFAYRDLPDHNYFSSTMLALNCFRIRSFFCHEIYQPLRSHHNYMHTVATLILPYKKPYIFIPQYTIIYGNYYHTINVRLYVPNRYRAIVDHFSDNYCSCTVSLDRIETYFGYIRWAKSFFPPICFSFLFFFFFFLIKHQNIREN